MGTYQVGVPYNSEGFLRAKKYTDDPDHETVPNWLSNGPDNEGNAFYMSQFKAIWDTLSVSTEVIPGIQLFNQLIEHDATVPVGLDGFTMSRGVADGVTVTVSPGSILTFGYDLT